MQQQTEKDIGNLKARVIYAKAVTHYLIAPKTPNTKRR